MRETYPCKRVLLKPLKSLAEQKTHMRVICQALQYWLLSHIQKLRNLNLIESWQMRDGQANSFRSGLYKSIVHSLQSASYNSSRQYN